MKTFFDFADMSSQKVRIILMVKDMTFVYNYGSEMSAPETAAMINRKQLEMKTNMTPELVSEAMQTMNHIYYISKRSKTGFRLVFENQTNEFLSKHVHEIMGTTLDVVLQRVTEDGSRIANCAFIRGDTSKKLQQYMECPEEKERDIALTKEKFFDAVFRLCIAGKIDGEHTFSFIHQGCYETADKFDVTRCYHIECPHRFERAKKASKAKKLTCGTCKVATYCSRECQVVDWKVGGHKSRCFPIHEVNAAGEYIAAKLREMTVVSEDDK